jgi:uncharacterized protein YoaH (UPF0181 family)
MAPVHSRMSDQLFFTDCSASDLRFERFQLLWSRQINVDHFNKLCDEGLSDGEIIVRVAGMIWDKFMTSETPDFDEYKR